MKQKYIDEKVGVYIIFGQRADGTVDVNDGNSDIFEGVTKEQAEKIVAAQERFREELYNIFNPTYSGSIRDRVMEENKPFRMQ